MLNKKDLEKIQAELEDHDLTREKMFETARSATRFSGWAIVQIHRQETKAVVETLNKARTALASLKEIVKSHSEFASSSNVVVAYQEYAEAKLLQGIASKGRILSQREVGVDVVPYMLGMLDLIGELRRMTLDHLRRGASLEAEKTLNLMEAIYEDLYALDHTAIIPTFRHKMDTARKLIEVTRGDVVTETRRLFLENSIDNLKTILTRTKGLKLGRNVSRSSDT